MFIFWKIGANPPHSLGDQLAKFMLSLREESFEVLQTEAEDRGITIQELIRAVIIPDWVKLNNVPRAELDNGDEEYKFSSHSREQQIYQHAMSRLR